MKTKLETWRAAFSLEEQTRWQLFMGHNYQTGFLTGFEPEFVDEFSRLSAKLNHFIVQLHASDQKSA